MLSCSMYSSVAFLPRERMMLEEESQEYTWSRPPRLHAKYASSSVTSWALELAMEVRAWRPSPGLLERDRRPAEKGEPQQGCGILLCSKEGASWIKKRLGSRSGTSSCWGSSE